MSTIKCRPLQSSTDSCDQNSDNGFERNSYLPWDTNGHLQNPSNVTRICRAIRPDGDNDVAQVIYYQAGIGTQESWWDHIYGGGTGAGLSENIREAYSFLAMNYTPGDEIFLIGFSRGAFTARSIAGLIAAVGLLTAKGMTHFYEVFNDWENQLVPNFKSKFPDKPFSKRPNVTDRAYGQELLAVSGQCYLAREPADGRAARTFAPRHSYPRRCCMGHSW